MKKLNRLELLIIRASIQLDEYVYTYNHYEYENQIGIEEFFRIRHVNDLIATISDNGSDFLKIIKQLSDDIDYITSNMKETGETSCLDQLNDAYELLQLLNEIA